MTLRSVSTKRGESPIAFAVTRIVASAGQLSRAAGDEFLPMRLWSAVLLLSGVAAIVASVLAACGHVSATAYAAAVKVAAATAAAPAHAEAMSLPPAATWAAAQGHAPAARGGWSILPELPVAADLTFYS